jgi:tRNA(Ile)-lysidine synthase
MPAAAEPIEPDEFDALMALNGPFEHAPDIAIACSGGPDSMALALLANEWARRKGGRAVALIVDHGLRPESASEARLVKQRLRNQDIEAETLTRRGEALSGDIQAQARDARFGLLTRWCAKHGFLHILFAHHREDQAETLLIRLERGSGVVGLSGMARIRETGTVRILRPFLGLSRSRLRATVSRAKVEFVEDPSNQDPKFARVRIRQDLSREGGVLSTWRLSETAAQMGAARNVVEDSVGAVLAKTCRIYPQGYCLLDWASLALSFVDVRRRALAAVLTCIGGRNYTPRYARICNLDGALLEGRIGGGRTLSGCQILKRGDDILICREPSAIIDEVILAGIPSGDPVYWDGRYNIQVKNAPEGACIKKFGDYRVANIGIEKKHAPLSSVIRQSTPTLWLSGQILAAPHLGYIDAGFEKAGGEVVKMAFSPQNPLTRARFAFA